ncbi:ADP-ribosyltransferase [Bacillus sp. BRMEA1]|nr:ADP-ribosyltransferase [Neobacillus endophyticus]
MAEVGVETGVKEVARQENSNVIQLVRKTDPSTISRIKSTSEAVSDRANVLSFNDAKVKLETKRLLKEEEIIPARKYALPMASGEDVGKVHIPSGNTHTISIDEIHGESVEGAVKGTGKGGNGIRGTDHSLKNVEEAHQWGRKYYDSWLESLTESERGAIKQYTGNDYKKINSYLRGFSDSLAGVDSQVIDHIKSGLSKAEVPYDMKVFRGTDLRPFDDILERDKDGKINLDSLVGKIFKDNGFVSTAIVKESSFDHMAVSWEINVPKGANAAYVGKISHFPDEAELLLNAGQEMIIKRVNVDSIGKLHVTFDLIIKK